MEFLLPSVITGAVSLLVCILNNRYQQNRMRDEYIQKVTEIVNKYEHDMQTMVATLNQAIAILDCKFDGLTVKVEKHNGVIERVYKLETDSELLKEKQSVANHRIDDIEKKMK